MRLLLPISALVLMALMAFGFLSKSDAVTDEAQRSAVERGRVVFMGHCTGCHGAEADGKGHLSEQIPGTRPRDFTQPSVATTPADSLKKTIRLGGLSRNMSPMMPGWETSLSVQEIDDVVTFVQAVSRMGGLPPVPNASL